MQLPDSELERRVALAGLEELDYLEPEHGFPSDLELLKPAELLAEQKHSRQAAAPPLQAEGRYLAPEALVTVEGWTRALTLGRLAVSFGWVNSEAQRQADSSELGCFPEER